MLLMFAVAIFSESLYLNVTLALWNYTVTQIKFFEYFYPFSPISSCLCDLWGASCA